MTNQNNLSRFPAPNFADSGSFVYETTFIWWMIAENDHIPKGIVMLIFYYLKGESIYSHFSLSKDKIFYPFNQISI